MSLLQNSNAISTGGGYNLESSLRFRSTASTYLSRTPTVVGDQTTWTWSAWVKRSALATQSGLFSAYNNDNNRTSIIFRDDDTLQIFRRAGGAFTFSYVPDMLFRDTSAWYHIVVKMDQSQTTASDRINVYVNGQLLTNDNGNYPGLNESGTINNTELHTIGRQGLSGGSNYFDGYITEVNFVDGQALTASDFGETDTTTGVWKPKEYEGTYGTNGFYLPMKETQQATGFNSVLYTGNGGTQSISNVGFSPDLVWIKDRTLANSNWLIDTVRGTGYELSSNQTIADYTTYTRLTSFDSNGFSVSASGSNQLNQSSSNYVAWCWDAGSSTVSNTDGTITSSVRANPASGFSIVTYTSPASGNYTVGHGLGTQPAMIINKCRGSGSAWAVWHKELTGGTSNKDYYLLLNSTNAQASITDAWGASAPTSDVFGMNAGGSAVASQTQVAYCFSEVAGYSKFGSYTGNGSTSGPTVTTGFRPAFVMIRRTDVAGSSWYTLDNTRSVTNPSTSILFPNQAAAEANFPSGTGVEFTDTGFQIKQTSPEINSSGNNFIYMAFADTRDAQFNFDASGNKNNWTANNINSNASSETTYDIMNDVATLTDEDTANFATLNPLSFSGTSPVLSNANLSIKASSAAYTTCPATMGVPNSGKFYWEVTLSTLTTATNNQDIGIGKYPIATTDAMTSSCKFGATFSTLTYYYSTPSTSATTIGVTPTVNDVMQVAYDADTGKVWFGYNNTWIVSGNPSAGTNPIYTYPDPTGIFPFLTMYNTIGQSAVNFGQRPFKYTPPTGYKKLNTYNLPDSTIVDGSQYMNILTWTGNATARSITGLGFSPDLVWIKNRGTAYGHVLQDTIRGTSVYLASNSTAADTAASLVTSFDSDGFSLSTSSVVNQASTGIVGWSWRGSDSSPVSNTDGTITSTVSANTTSGFSVVTYTGNGSNGSTIGHGLGVAPKMVIYKNRSATGVWLVLGYPEFSSVFTANNSYLQLDSTQAIGTAGTIGATHGASTITINNSGSNINASGNNYVAYCFADVEGFSKFGSYTGNGNADGPMIWTGFRPKFLMIKRTDTAGNSWIIQDTSRSSYNQVANTLFPNLSDAESTGTTLSTDILSNGFKVRASGSTVNASGGTYIYMCFGSNPFKNSLAR